MLKGKMTLELCDEKTGEREVVAEENLVTDALSNIFQPLGLSKDIATLYSTFTPYYQNLFGGLLIFDGEITEKASQYYAPSSVNPVGYGVYNAQNSTTGTLRGGYNETESVYDEADKTMKYVYDFSTSQANGTIACVCLTHTRAGYNGYGGKDAVVNGSTQLGIAVSSTTLQYAASGNTGGSTGDALSGYTVGATEMLFAIDPDADLAYYFRIDSASTITITARAARLKAMSLFELPVNNKPLTSSQPITLPTELLSTSNVSYSFDATDNCLYLVVAASSSVDTNGDIQVTRIKFGAWAVTQYAMSNTSGVKLGSSGTRHSFVHNGWLLMKSYSSPYAVYKFELGNTANVTELTLTGIDSMAGTFTLGLNGRVYAEYVASSTNFQLYVINLESDEVLPSEAKGIYAKYSSGARYPCYVPVLGNGMLWFASFGSTLTGAFIVPGNYLATINNLSEPVTKTADKTMKVTYTIQEK